MLTGDLDVPAWLWATFGISVVVMLAIDLLMHRKDHVIGFREAAIWSGVWVGLSLVFAVLVWYVLGGNAAVEFTTAWLLEKSLSVDNLFVFALIFSYFAVPREYQHRVLFFGVMGALIFRGIFLIAGVAIVQQFTWVLFIFAAVLLYSAVKLLRSGDEDEYDPSSNPAVKLLRRFVPMQDEYDGHKFFTRRNGKRIATPLLAVVVAIEMADLVFAVDSVPAVLAVSSEPFIVYSSNAFAILGLRALYFLLSGLLDKFHYLGKGLGIILGFIGLKLIVQATHEYVPQVPHIPSFVSLMVIVVVLTGSIVLSIKRPLPADEAEHLKQVMTAADAPESTPATTPSSPAYERTTPDGKLDPSVDSRRQDDTQP